MAHMFRDFRLLFWITGLLAVCVWAGWSWFSPKARLQRRRRKSHSRIVSKANRPMVRFSVRPPKE